MMHTLGFDHEQCRSDRDNYVIINFDNMKSGKSQFYKTNTLDRTPYDYESIMQYGLEVRISISILHQLVSYYTGSHYTARNDAHDGVSP